MSGIFSFLSNNQLKSSNELNLKLLKSKYGPLHYLIFKSSSKFKKYSVTINRI